MVKHRRHCRRLAALAGGLLILWSLPIFGAEPRQQGVLHFLEQFGAPLRDTKVEVTFASANAVTGRTVTLTTDADGNVAVPGEALLAGSFLVSVPSMTGVTHTVMVPPEHDRIRFVLSPRDWVPDEPRAAVVTAAQATTAQTRTFTIDCWDDAFGAGNGNNCDFCTGTIQPNHRFTYACNEGTSGTWHPTCSFTDPLPASTKVTKIEAAIDMKDCSGQRGYAQTVFATDMDGTQIAPAQTLSINNCGCTVTPGCMLADFVSPDYPNGFPGYQAGQTNTFAFDITTGAICVEKVNLTLTYEPLNSFDFNVTDVSPEIDRRIILSNPRSDFPIPQYHHFQSIGALDSAVPMFVRARGQSGNYEAGLTVYLRVTDPADPAAYMNLPNNVLAHDGDNKGPAATLDLPLMSGSTSVYQATTTTNGQIDFKLTLAAGTAAGDNFQIEASFDSTFPAGASKKSGTLTAWKRIVVEKHRMLRNGLQISQPAAIGDSTIQVHLNHYGGNTGTHARLSSGDTIVLVHSAALDRHDALDGSYAEYHTIADVHRVPQTDDYVITLGTGHGNNQQLEHLQHPFGPELLDAAVGDGIARIAAQPVTSADVFDASDALLAQYDLNGKPATAFPQAFVEYLLLPDTFDFGSVPLPYVNTGQETVLQHLADRWSTSVGWNGGPVPAPNHQLLMIGDNNGATPPDEVGRTTHVISGEISSIVFRGTINAQVTSGNPPHSGQDPEKWASKTVAHELTHQWTVDGVWAGTPHTTLGHCPETFTVFDDPSIICLEATASTTGSETQSDNMVARFHLQQTPGGDWHSEYFEIRQRMDPFLP